MYYLYHIPGKKIGVTRNLNTRVTLMQGYKEGEYEVLEQSDDINFISDREIELQKSYGYKVDRKLYKNLFKKMNINATEQTSTFPCPANKLKGHLMDNIGLSWETLHGKFEINSTTIPWIVHNVKTSMYNEERCYIYNKAYYEAFVAEPAAEVTGATVFDSIRDWADKRGIYDSGDTKTQFVKLMEEIGELGQAILKDDEAEFIDAIGDSVVVLTNLAKLGGHDIERCIESAYNEISARSGSMVNGTFVKDAD
jgi:NTP pyrophosphatase (non-canonical NTP hydrolase)